MQRPLTIGTLAKAAGVNVETIRYYQRRGLIGEPNKPMGGHRKYEYAVVGEIAFIRRAQQLGFSLAEVKELLGLADGKGARKTRAIAETKVEFLDRQIEQLTKMRKRLATLIDASRRGKPGDFDPLIAELDARPAPKKTR